MSALVGGAYPDRPRRIAIIPARGGSKGLPGKNLAEIAGESLLSRAVRCARATGLFNRILVSTDDPRIAEEGRRAGAAVPFLRPAELAGDAAAVVDAVRDALRRLREDHSEAFDLVALLEPTSPLRTPDIVRAVVLAAEGPGSDAALSVSPVPTRFHVLKQFVIPADGLAQFAVEKAREIVNRQELGPTFIRNGMAYAVRTPALDVGFGMLGGAARAVIIDGPYANIDDPADLVEARRLVAEGATPRVRTESAYV